ncbi:MAG: hypothetical protein JWP19_279 [Rhodoglobus sp.]|nr:hypothetical protein [Rhodoglobus sp.]
MTAQAVRELAAGQGFVEGPVAMGDSVAFVSINRGTILSSALDGSGTVLLAEVGGGPNGMALGPDGALWIAQNGGRVMEPKSFAADPGIMRLVDGEVVASGSQLVNAPNDCAFGPDGRLWFTDPYGRLQPAVDEPRGRVLALDIATGEYEVIAEGLKHPNGLCFDAAGDVLYINDTNDRTISRIERDGTGWTAPVLHAELPQGQPDGMAFDSDGALWVAATTAEGVATLHPDGRWTFTDLGPSFPTNLCFAGTDRTVLVVTAARGGRILALDVEVSGLQLR